MWVREVPSGVQDKAPVCEISVQFLAFSCIKLNLMTIRAALEEYMLQTHNTPNPSLGTPVDIIITNVLLIQRVKQV